MTEQQLLTDDEIAVIGMAGELWNRLCAVVADGPTRDGDLAELIIHIHAIQRAVGAQAAARAYPDQFRRLGVTLEKPVLLKNHQHEDWQLRDDGRGGVYCAACGATVVPPA